MGDPPVGLEIILGEGAVWPVLSRSGFAVFIVSVFLLLLISYTLARLYINRQKEKEHIQHLFLFKSRHAGLSSFQQNILKAVASVSSPDNPLQIFQYPSAFQKAVTQFINYLFKIKEKPEAVKKIIKDIIIIYEKIYHFHQYQEPLEDAKKMETGILAAISSGNSISIGKIIFVNSAVTLHLIPPAMKDPPEKGGPVQLYFWRAGDAGYTLSCSVKSLQKDTIELIPEEAPERSDEIRHPLISTMVPCEFSPAPGTPAEKLPADKKSVAGTIIKVNEYEIVAQLTRPVDLSLIYSVEFIISDKKIYTEVNILNERSLLDENYYAVTCKIQFIDSEGEEVFKQYIVEHL